MRLVRRKDLPEPVGPTKLTTLDEEKEVERLAESPEGCHRKPELLVLALTGTCSSVAAAKRLRQFLTSLFTSRGSLKSTVSTCAVRGV
jgi:hypothetical protein